VATFTLCRYGQTGPKIPKVNKETFATSKGSPRRFSKMSKVCVCVNVYSGEDGSDTEMLSGHLSPISDPSFRLVIAFQNIHV
jgi:hypothetical protein